MLQSLLILLVTIMQGDLMKLFPLLKQKYLVDNQELLTQQKCNNIFRD